MIRTALAAFAFGQVALPDGYSGPASPTQQVGLGTVQIATTGVVKLFVDPTGSDSNPCTASGASACKNPQAAFNKLPKYVRDLEYINIACGDYYAGSNWTLSGAQADDSLLPAPFALQGFIPDIGRGIAQGNGYNPYSPSDGGTVMTVIDTKNIGPRVLVEGTMTVAAGPLTPTGSNTESAGLITVTQAAAGWTVNQFAGMFLKFLSGTGFQAQQLSPNTDNNIYPIVSNTASAITAINDDVLGTTNTDTTTSYEIVQPCTAFHSYVDAGANYTREVFDVSASPGMGGNYSNFGVDTSPGANIEIRYVKFDQPGEAIGLGIHDASVRLYGVQAVGNSGNGSGLIFATDSFVELIRSSVTWPTGFMNRAMVLLFNPKSLSYIGGSYLNSSTGSAFTVTGGGNEVWYYGNWTTSTGVAGTGGGGNAINLVGPSYVRTFVNNYVTSGNGAAVGVQRGAIIRFGGLVANATGNSNTWGVRCSQTGAVFVAATTTVTGTTGDASVDGTNTISYANIRAATPPTVFSMSEGCYVGQE